MRDPERGNVGDKDNKKTNVCQYKHASACQWIPLWLIWKGWFLARRMLEALTRLLLHSSASYKAPVCSNWLRIRSDWLEVSEINERSEAALCARASKILTRCSIQTDNKIASVARWTEEGAPVEAVRVFFCFYFKINKSVILQSLMLDFKVLALQCGAQGQTCVSAPWTAPPSTLPCMRAKRGSEKPRSETESKAAL